MDSKVIEIKSKLIPGKPLLVVGNYGTGKLERTIHAIESLGLKKHLCFMDLIDYDFPWGFDIKQWAKSSHDSDVMVFDGMHRADSRYHEFILTQMKNPDRIVVLIGNTCPLAMAMKCSLVTISTEEHLKLYFESIGYAPHLHG